jgi:hypothetical protein
VTIPAITKWRPWPYFSRTPRMGWLFCIYVHRDHNPVLALQRWGGITYFEFWERFTYRSDTGWYVWPRIPHH